MKSFFAILLLAFSLVPRAAFAEELGPCSDMYEKAGAFEFQRMQGATNCMVLANPANAGTDFYRSAVYSDDGMFMVFNSYEYSKKTDGSRVFYFFPRTRHPSFQKDNLGRMMVQTSAPGIFFQYHNSLPRFYGMLGGIIKEDPKVTTENQGGVELSFIKTLWLDAGFMMKGDPTADLQRTSNFIDDVGKRCEVSNGEIFALTPDGDSYFKFTDSKLKAFLSARCPKLHINF